jgi:hypothetical protein
LYLSFALSVSEFCGDHEWRQKERKGDQISAFPKEYREGAEPTESMLYPEDCLRATGTDAQVFSFWLPQTAWEHIPHASSFARKKADTNGSTTFLNRTFSGRRRNL